MRRLAHDRLERRRRTTAERGAQSNAHTLAGNGVRNDDLLPLPVSRNALAALLEVTDAVAGRGEELDVDLVGLGHRG